MTENGINGCRSWALGFLVLLNFLTVLHADTLEVVRRIPHSGYSEGLDYRDGFLWHALPKAILKIDPKDGAVVDRFTPGSEYSESLVWMGKDLWNLSFSDNGIYRGRMTGKTLKFEKMGTTLEVHGWGLEKIGQELVFTGNYSNKLYFWNPTSRTYVRILPTEGKDLEDLAWDGKQLWSSSYTTDRGGIFSLDTKTGKKGPLVTLPNPEECPVVDGLAFDGKHLWVTGKECASIYQVKVPTSRALTGK